MTDKREIFPPYEAFYLQSMLFNSTAACECFESFSHLIDYIQANLDWRDNILTADALNTLQSAIIHCGALSRYFWPIDKNHSWRGVHLRARFGLTEESPLHSRTLRNALEHLDEKLDDYLEGNITGYIFPEYFDLAPDESGPPAHLFRAYFINTGQFHLLGNSYEIQPLADEIVRLHNMIAEASDNGGRLPAIKSRSI